MPLRPRHRGFGHLLQGSAVVDDMELHILGVAAGWGKPRQIEQLKNGFARNRFRPEAADGTPGAQEIRRTLLRRQLGRIDRLLSGAGSPDIVDRFGRTDRHAVSALDALILADLWPRLPHFQHARRTIVDAEAAPDARFGIQPDKIFVHHFSPFLKKFSTVAGKYHTPARPKCQLSPVLLPLGRKPKYPQPAETGKD